MGQWQTHREGTARESEDLEPDGNFDGNRTFPPARFEPGLEYRQVTVSPSPDRRRSNDSPRADARDR